MNSDNRRPSQVLFQSAHDGWMRPVPHQDSHTKSFLSFQEQLQRRRSIGLLEVELLRSEMENAELTLQEIAALEQAARTRAVTSERMNGWHSGFRDVAEVLQNMRAARKGEVN